MEIKNLWGEIGNIPQIKPPITILKEQAQMLEKITKGLLIARIVDERESKGALGSLLMRGFNYTFLILAPSLNNYTYNILTIQYDVDLYPVNIKRGAQEAIAICKDVDEFEQVLEEILSSDKIKKVITGLLAQVQAA